MKFKIKSEVVLRVAIWRHKVTFTRNKVTIVRYKVTIIFLFVVEIGYWALSPTYYIGYLMPGKEN